MISMIRAAPDNFIKDKIFFLMCEIIQVLQQICLIAIPLKVNYKKTKFQ